MGTAELTSALMGQVRIPLLIALMALGYIIKHTPALNKISNALIPVILLITAIVIALVLNGDYSMQGITQAVVSGLINAAIAVYMHESGRNIFGMLNSEE